VALGFSWGSTENLSALGDEMVGKRGHVIDLCLNLTKVRDVFADMLRSYLSETILFRLSNFLTEHKPSAYLKGAGRSLLQSAMKSPAISYP
jgi:hypothetical protein